MSSGTGIELGPDSCVLVAVSRRRRGAEITALRVIGPDEWPRQDVAVAELLRTARRRGRFPRSARVVAWGVPDAVRPDDPMVRAALRPVVDAGFRIDAVLSPPQALARLGGGRARGAAEAVAWLALNRSSAAVAIVRAGELLFSRAFEWSSRPKQQAGARSELLQRYSLVSHLAPEVQRGIAMVNASRGLRVDTAVTCGDLPDLRSLTMPLIEELDLEVETLDSTEGLRAGRRVRPETLAEHAPALRLACAAASAPSERRQTWALLRLAAALVLLAGAGWAAFTHWTLPRRPTPSPATVTAPAPAQKPTIAAAPPQRPAIVSPPPQQPTPAPATPKPSIAPAPATPTPSPASAPAPPPVVEQKPVPPPQQPAQVPSDTSRARRPVPSSQPPPEQSRPRPRAVPLKDALPVVNSILIDGNRRLALIEGRIVQVGDVVGRRTVADIEHDSVVLREPSGLLVRVGLGRQPIEEAGTYIFVVAAELGRPYNQPFEVSPDTREGA